MRIAVATWTLSRIGGAQIYVEQCLAGLIAAGHQVAVLAETVAPEANKSAAELPNELPVWCIETDGDTNPFEGLSSWKPDLIFDNNLMSVANILRIQEIAPCVLYAHNYYGACISGGKLWNNPSLRCCERSFGWGCLLHYYPRRCGGRHPLRLISQFRTQMGRRDRLGDYAGIFVASNRMKLEYERLGLPGDRVKLLPYPIQREMSERAAAGDAAADIQRRTAELADTSAPLRLLFVGRMEGSKGGELALAALPLVADSLSRPVHLTLCGDGSQRAAWEEKAREWERVAPRVRVRFAGWLSQAEIDAEYRAAQILVLPSIWPEPFGLVGLEAGLFGLPAVAFAVGGIPDWLSDGETGTLAPGDQLNPFRLAEAINRLAKNPEYYAHCATGALRRARGWTDLPEHIRELEMAFRSLLDLGAPTP